MGRPGPRGAGIIIARSLTEVAAVNTAAEVDLVNQSIAGSATADGAAVGDVYSLEAWGKRLNNSGLAVTYQPQMYLGATKILTTTALSLAASVNPARWWLKIRVFLAAINDQRIGGPLIFGPTGSGTWALNTSTAIAIADNTAAEDMTSAKTLRYTITLGTADANADFRIRGWTLTRERA